MSADSFFKQFTFPTAGAAARNVAALQRPNGGAATTWCVDQRPQQKRRRLRRHPVWMFYRDLEDRVRAKFGNTDRNIQMVGCINCDFKTGSAFSTNLKMHLKAHHKEDYAKVLKLEDEMRIEEGIAASNENICRCLRSSQQDQKRADRLHSRRRQREHPDVGGYTVQFFPSN